jgi:hypothetical protein
MEKIEEKFLVFFLKRNKDGLFLVRVHTREEHFLKRFKTLKQTFRYINFIKKMYDPTKI